MTFEELDKEYHWGKKLSKYTVKHYAKVIDNYWGKIRNNDDIESIIQSITNGITYYSEIYPLHNDDIITLEKSLGMYEIAMCKILQCPSSFEYSIKEVLEMITDDYHKYVKGVQQIHMRMMCQD